MPYSDRPNGSGKGNEYQIIAGWGSTMFIHAYGKLNISPFSKTSALPMGFLPDSHPHKLMINYSIIKS